MMVFDQNGFVGNFSNRDYNKIAKIRNSKFLVFVEPDNSFNHLEISDVMCVKLNLEKKEVVFCGDRDLIVKVQKTRRSKKVPIFRTNLALENIKTPPTIW